MAGDALSGTIQIFVDEEPWLLKADATVMGDFEREAVEGEDGIHGFIEKKKAPGIKATITFADPVTLEKLKNVTDATIQLDRPGKPSVVLYNAWTAGGHEINLSNADVSIEFRGKSMKEIG